MATISAFAGVGAMQYIMQDIMHSREFDDEANIVILRSDMFREFFCDELRKRVARLACHYARVMRAGCNVLRIRGFRDALLIMRSLVRMCEAPSSETYQKQRNQARMRQLAMSEIMSDKLDALMERTSEDVRQYANVLKKTYENIGKLLNFTEKVAGSRWV
jgi:hypothetical protein